MRRGVPSGFIHRWFYGRGSWHEKKISPKEWQFVYKTTKLRKKAARRGSGMPKGSKLHWKIDADQYAIKRDEDTYDLITRGSKRLVKTRVPKKRRWKRRRRKKRFKKRSRYKKFRNYRGRYSRRRRYKRRRF